MINGIPPLVSDRGALPETVREGGCVLPVPPWLTPTADRLPSGLDVRPWFDAVCRFWDEPAWYARASAAARSTAERYYREDVMKRRYYEYFSRVGHRAPAVPLSALWSCLYVGR
jgi:glycosyltransferase involved in cell wall biosynthesis